MAVGGENGGFDRVSRSVSIERDRQEARDRGDKYGRSRQRGWRKGKKKFNGAVVGLSQGRVVVVVFRLSVLVLALPPCAQVFWVSSAVPPQGSGAGTLVGR